MLRYLDVIRDQARTRMTDLVQMLTTFTIPNSTNAESKAFFFSLAGNIMRYHIGLIKCVDDSTPSETMTPMQKKSRRDRDQLISKANESFHEAFKLSVNYLTPVNPIRLSVALNYTIFLFDLKQEHNKAIKLLEITQELAMTLIDDAAEPELLVKQEQAELLNDIAANI